MGTKPSSYLVDTFAAPTAGNTYFARFFNSSFQGNTSKVWFNPYDIVPHAWGNLTEILKYYEMIPGGGAMMPLEYTALMALWQCMLKDHNPPIVYKYLQFTQVNLKRVGCGDVLFLN